MKPTQTSKFSSSINKKLIKVIPIKDPLIAKLLIKNPDDLLNPFSTLAQSFYIHYQFQIDEYSTSLELSTENHKNTHLEALTEKFLKFLEELKKNLDEVKIPCNLEEYKSLVKYIEKGRISSDIDLHFINEINNKPLIIKKFVMNESFSIQILLIEELEMINFEENDNLVINFTRNGVFLDKIMQNQMICQKITKIFKKNQNLYINNQVFEANLPEFNVFLQIFDSKDLLEEGFHIEMTRKYIKQILERILSNKQLINLYYPLPFGLEEETLKAFLEEILEISKTSIFDMNFLSKISFLCLEKQKEIISEICEEIKALGSLEKIPQELKQGGKWSIINNNFDMMVTHNNDNLTGKVLNVRVSKVIEKAFILGEKKGVVFINERKIQNPQLNTNEKTNGFFMNNLLYQNNNKTFGSIYQIKKEDVNKKEKNEKNFANVEEICINLKKMTEESKMTSYKKPLILNEMAEQFFYFDMTKGEYLNYEPQINKILIFFKRIHHNKLIFHRDLETMLPIESLYKFDLTNFTLMPDEISLKDNNSTRNPNIMFPFNNDISQNHRILNISRTKNGKFNSLLKKTSKFIKNNGFPLKIIESSSLEVKKLLNKTPQLSIRCIEDIHSIVQTIKEILCKKKIVYFMKMKQDSAFLKKSLEDLCQRNNIQWELKEKVLKIEGNRKTINKIQLEIQNFDEMDLEDATLPENWDPQVENLKEIELESISFEFYDISQVFNNTCPDFEIVKITRIQNKKLWENYIFEKKRLKFKGNCTEKMLFHGTRTNDPHKIYSGIEDGFDVRLANHGIVGKGIYFAEAASYSVSGYAYHKKNGNFVILYANVLVGACCENMGNNKYTIPPLMQNSSNMRFDSVKNRNNYTVFNGNRAYPAYMIEYKRTKHLNKLMGIENNVFKNDDENEDEEDDASSDEEEEEKKKAEKIMKKRKN